MADEDEDVKLSPEDIERIKKVTGLLGQARGILEEISEDVREEIGDIADAITKMEEAEDLIDEHIPEEAEGDAA